MLQVHRSPDLGLLADALGGVLAAPLDDVFQAERVMVSGPATARWLEARMATTGPHRVWANVDTPYPATFVREVVDDVLRAQDLPLDPWAPEQLTWVLAEHLVDVVASDDVFAPVRRYLVGRDGGDLPTVVDRRVLGLAGDVARLLDRYSLHRPAMLARWRRGDDVDRQGQPLSDDQRWQPALLRALAPHQPVLSPAERIGAAVEQLARRGPSLAVPSRVSAFGVAALPPLHLQLLSALALHRDVHLFVVTPSARVWATDLPPLSEDRDVHPLLRSGGAVARDLPVVLRASAEALGLTPDLRPFVARGAPQSVLGRLQADVAAGVPSTPTEPMAVDDSLAFHDCHGPLRQVEVLHDELRRRLDDDPTLEPRDIAVLTPDLDTHGPLLAAAFATPLEARWAGGRAGADGPPPIPVAVVARGPATGNPIAQVLRRMLALAVDRVGAADVLDLLAVEPVRGHLRLTASELGTVERWVRDTGVRWARDEQDRAAAGQPAHREHTWAAAVDRLLVGVAMADDGAGHVGGVVPYDHVEDAGELDLLERLLTFLGVVDDLRGLRVARSVAGWADTCVELLDRLTGPPDGDPWLDDAVRARHERDRARVDRVLAGLRPFGDALGRDVEVRAFRRWVDATLDASAGGGGHATGAVTVGDFAQLRGLPFRIVCLLGMDEGSVPRSAARSGHDLVAGDPAPGDPDRRAEDRHVFLESLMAARDAVVVTWSGRDQRTGRDRPPAVLVTELLEAAGALVGDAAVAGLTTRHAVLPTAPRAFAAAGPRSYDTARLAAARAGQGEPVDVTDFVPVPLPDDVDEPRPAAMSLDDLCRILQHPARALTRRLRLAASDDAATWDDAEPLELDPLARSAFGRALLSDLRRSTDGVERVTAAALRRGDVPGGSLGRFVTRPVRSEVVELAAVVERLGDGATVPVDLQLGGVRVSGAVEVVALAGAAYVLEVRYARPAAKRRLELRLRQLAATVASGTSVAGLLVTRAAKGAGLGTEVVAAPATLEEARAELAAWVALAGRATGERIDLLPAVAWEWIATRRPAELAAIAEGHPVVDVEGADDDELVALAGTVGVSSRSTVASVVVRASRAAGEAWEGGFRSRAERDDEANRLVFRHVLRFDELVARTDVLAVAGRLRPLVDAVDRGRDDAAALLEELTA